jgi:hypothetical protein
VLWAIDLVVVLTGLGFVVAGFNVAIRILFAMGRERALPGALARLSSRQTPAASIGGVIVAGACEPGGPRPSKGWAGSSRRPYPAALTGCPWAWSHRRSGRRA